MIELYLILIPVLFAAVIVCCRNERNIRCLLIIAALFHLAGVLALLLPGLPMLHSLPELPAGWLFSDGISQVVIAVCSGLFFAVSVNLFFWLPAAKRFESSHATMPSRFFCSALCLFLGTMSLTAFAGNFGLLWVAVEATTLASAPLIAYHRSKGALEAMWKYLIICSVGIGLALFGTFLLGAALRFSGEEGNLSMLAISRVKNALDYQWYKAAYLFCLAGYGLKMGLAPFHVWLPDAHSEAPGSVSVLLSGTLLNCAFLGITRVMGVAPDALLGFCREFLVAGGVLSLLIAACFIIRQEDFKRMLAYSSIEHMGIIAIFWGLQEQDMALIHLTCHSACKMLLFLTAGNILLAYGTRKCALVNGMFSVMPLTASVWLTGILLICAVPPSPLFVTELHLIRKAGPMLGSVILLLLFVIFCGMTSVAMKMTMGKAENLPLPDAAKCASGLSILPALLGILPVAAGIYFIFQL